MQFIEVTALYENRSSERTFININQIAYFAEFGKGTDIYIVGHIDPLYIEETYESFKDKLETAHGAFMYQKYGYIGH